MLFLLYALSFLWSFLEASFWWVAPDISIGIAYVYFPRYWKRFLGLALVGAFLGSGVTYLWAAHYPLAWNRYVSHMRFHSAQNLSYVRAVLEPEPLAIIKAAWGGVPYKLFFGLAPQVGVPFGKLAFLGLLARALRFCFSLWIVTLIRRVSAPWSSKNPGKLCLILLLLWAAMIVLFDMVINRHYLA